MESDIDGGSSRIGIVLYSTKVKIIFHLNDYATEADTLAAIDDIEYIFGNTFTAGGIKALRTDMFKYDHGDRPEVPNIAFVITDGQSNRQNILTIPEAVKSRLQGITIYAVGIGLTETIELQGIASKPISDYMFTAKSFEDLQNMKQDIFNTFCSGGTLKPTTTLPIETTVPTAIILPEQTTSISLSSSTTPFIDQKGKLLNV